MTWNETLDQLPASNKAAVTAEGNRIRILGGAGTGKSLSLILRIIKAIEEGANPATMIVFVSNRNSVNSFKARLAAFEVPGTELVNVYTPRDFALETLAIPEIQADTGRVPRVVSKVEESFYNEDMKVTGILPKRLKEILNFFYREFTELENFEAGWIVSEEEDSLYKWFTQWMDDHKCMHESEVINVLVKYMLDNPVEWRKSIFFEHIYADDYQNYNKGAQVLISTIAEEAELVIAGNENETTSLMEAYPYPDGIEDFAFDNKDAITVELTMAIGSPQYITAMSNSLLECNEMISERMAEIDPDAPLGAVELVKWTTPDDEIDGLVKFLKGRFDETGENPLFPGDVFIVIPNKVWGKNLMKKFDRARIKTSSIMSSRLVAGDPRDLTKSVAMRAYTNLGLVANPEDPLLWRAYMGYGDHLTNSLAWDRFRKWATREGYGILEGLQYIAENEGQIFADVDLIRNAYKSGQELIKKCSTRSGFGLLHTLAEGGDFPRDVMELFGDITGNETAETLYKIAYNQLADPQFIISRQFLRIGCYESLVGQSPRLIIFAGLINGFYPTVSEEADYAKIPYPEIERKRNKERKVFHGALSKATEEVIISYFQKEDIFAAEKLRMEIHRVRAENGQRVVTLTPSRFILDMGSTVPGAISGSRLK